MGSSRFLTSLIPTAALMRTLAHSTALPQATMYNVLFTDEHMHRTLHLLRQLVQ